MKCPVCNALYRPSDPPAYSCRRCGVDLSPSLLLVDRALRYHRQAIEAFRAGDDETAIDLNNQALAIWSNNAEFQAFAGQISARRGDFRTAARAWRKALQLNPQQSIARDGLQFLRELSARDRPEAIEFF